MEWIKATPDNMPPENQAVLVTIFVGDTEQQNAFVWADVRWSDKGRWEYLSNSWDGIWSTIDDGAVTHWMPYPEPAKE